MTPTWSTSQAITAVLAKRWEDGTILRELVGRNDPAAFPLRIRLTRPTTDDLKNDLAAVRTWARGLAGAASASGWEVDTRPLRGSSLIGAQTIPWSITVPGPETALRSLSSDYRRQAVAYRLAWDRAAQAGPWAQDVAAEKPLDVASLGRDWPMLLDITIWLVRNPRPGVPLRMIPVTGADTKVVERNRKLARMLFDRALPEAAIDPTAQAFEDRYGFAVGTFDVTLTADGATVGLPHLSTATVTWPLDGLAGIDPHHRGISQVVLVENKACLTSTPPACGRAVVWTMGRSAAAIAAGIPWLTAVDCLYWGDLDTWGFAILSDVRGVLPDVRSILMDPATLSAHISSTTTEPTPRPGGAEHLTAAEADALAALSENNWRIEQEHLDRGSIQSAFGTAPPPDH